MHSPLHPPCVGSGMEGAGLLHIMLRGGKVGTSPGFRPQDGHRLPVVPGEGSLPSARTALRGVGSGGWQRGFRLSSRRKTGVLQQVPV